MEDLFPENEDVIFQVYFLNLALRLSLDRGSVKNKTEFSKLVFPSSEKDPLGTMNQSRTLNPDGEPQRRMSLREAMRASKLAGVHFPSFCWDVDNRVRSKDPPPAP